MNFSEKLSFSLLLLTLVFTPIFSQAAEVTVRPFLIDETMVAREVIERTVTIKNDFDYRKVVLYATVNEITVDNTGEIKEFVSPVMTDRTNTVTSWIEVGRGRIEVEPSGTTEIPITVRTHPYAEPGEYHVFVGFITAPNRPAAEAIAMAGDGDGVIVKITIADERQESMHISAFLINRFIASKDNQRAAVTVENLGDVASELSGEIIFYNSRGIEVSSAAIDSAGTMVQPNETITLESAIPLDNKFGRFKANLSLKYGEKQQSTLYDTTNFYMIPLQWLLGLFIITLLVAITSIMWLRRAFADDTDPDGCDEVTMYVKDGHDPEPKHHDIDLTENN